MQFKRVTLAAAGALTSVKATEDKGSVVTNVAVVHEFPAVSVSTVLSTSYITVLDCGPGVTDCPLTTSVVAVSTTICPLTLTSLSTASADSGVIPPLPGTSSTTGDAVTGAGSSSNVGTRSTSTVTITSTLSGTSTVTLSSKSSIATVPSDTSSIPGGAGSPSSGSPASSSPSSSSPGAPASTSSTPASGASTSGPAGSASPSGPASSSSGPASAPSSSASGSAATSSTPAGGVSDTSSASPLTSSASSPAGGSSSSVSSPASGASEGESTSTSSVTLTSTLTSTTQVTVVTSASDSSYAPLQPYDSSSLTGIANNATGLTASSAIPVVTASPAINPTGGYGNQPSSNVAGALGATGTISGGIPGATGNGSLATASPSVQPFTSAAAYNLDSSILVCMIIGFTTAMLVI